MRVAQRSAPCRRPGARRSVRARRRCRGRRSRRRRARPSSRRRCGRRRTRTRRRPRSVRGSRPGRATASSRCRDRPLRNGSAATPATHGAAPTADRRSTPGRRHRHRRARPAQDGSDSSRRRSGRATHSGARGYAERGFGAPPPRRSAKHVVVPFRVPRRCVAGAKASRLRGAREAAAGGGRGRRVADAASGAPAQR